MGEHSAIEWTDHTFNPWIGCTKVSPGCDNCYAERWDKRFAGAGRIYATSTAKQSATRWGPGKERALTSDINWRKPVVWSKKLRDLGGRSPRVFCASLADVFDNEVPDEWRVRLFRLIFDTSNLDWLILTKRIGMVARYLERDEIAKIVFKSGHARLGITVVNQDEAGRDIPKLLSVDAASRFLSIEPMLGPVSIFGKWHLIKVKRFGSAPIDWVIVGGETGPSARPMNPDWARIVRDQCGAVGVPFFFKQWGEFSPNWYNDNDGKKIEGSEWIDRSGRRKAGRSLDGVEHNEFPPSKVSKCLY